MCVHQVSVIWSTKENLYGSNICTVHVPQAQQYYHKVEDTYTVEPKDNVAKSYREQDEQIAKFYNEQNELRSLNQCYYKQLLLLRC